MMQVYDRKIFSYNFLNTSNNKIRAVNHFNHFESILCPHVFSIFHSYFLLKRRFETLNLK